MIETKQNQNGWKNRNFNLSATPNFIQICAVLWTPKFVDMRDGNKNAAFILLFDRQLKAAARAVPHTRASDCCT
jgi:hypothetical protein